MLSAFLLIFGSIWLARLSIESQKEDKTQYEELKNSKVVLYLTIATIFLQSAFSITLLNNINDNSSTVRIIALASIFIGFLPLLAIFLSNTLQKYTVVIVAIVIQAVLGVVMIIGLQVTVGFSQIFSVLFTILVVRMLLLEKKLLSPNTQHMKTKINEQQINDLLEFLSKQTLFKQIQEEEVLWVNLTKHPTHLEKIQKLLNKKYFLRYSGGLLPILQNQEDVICLYEGKYLHIHISSPGWENRGEYTTPKELWEKKIKKDIEYYYE